MAVSPHSLLSVDGFNPPTPTYPEGLGGFATVGFLLDFESLLASQAWTVNPANGDFIALCQIPVGAQIHGVVVKVITALADTLGTGTILGQVGDYSAITGTGTAIDLDGYTAVTTGSDLTTVATYASSTSEAYMQASKVYASAAYLCLTFSGTAVDIISGKLWIAAKMSQMVFPDLTTLAPSTWH